MELCQFEMRSGSGLEPKAVFKTRRNTEQVLRIGIGGAVCLPLLEWREKWWWKLPRLLPENGCLFPIHN